MSGVCAPRPHGRLMACSRETGPRPSHPFPVVRVVDPELLHRAVEVYEAHRLDFADAFLVASAERTGVAEIASFDRAIDRVGTVRRVEP